MRELAQRILADLERGEPTARAIVAALAARYRQDWRGFITDVLGLELTAFHARWFEHQLRHRRSILLAPRGHGKSLICNTAFILWHIVRDPNVRVLIASKTAGQAQLFLEGIKQHIERNHVFRLLFGNLVGEPWRDNQIRVPCARLGKEPTVYAVGIGGSLPSWHFDVIVVDDPHDIHNSRTEGQRELVWQWYMEVALPTLEPHGEIHVIGTRWHPQDLFGRLIQTGEYAVLVDSALRDGKPLWPEKFSLETLEKLKAQMGPTLFALQYLQDARVAVAGPVFSREKFHIVPDPRFHVQKRVEYVVQAWDLATGAKEWQAETNYTACVTVGVLPDGDFVVLDWWRGRVGLAEQIRQIQRLAEIWQPNAVVVEAVAYQKVLADHLLQTTRLPIVPVTPDADKVRRAWAVQPYVEAGRVHVCHEVQGLVDVLVAFPYGEEDDSVDAFVYALDRARQYVPKGMREKIPPRRGM